jgi:hypothetical protein
VIHFLEVTINAMLPDKREVKANPGFLKKITHQHSLSGGEGVLWPLKT